MTAQPPIAENAKRFSIREKRVENMRKVMSAALKKRFHERGFKIRIKN